MKLRVNPRVVLSVVASAFVGLVHLGQRAAEERRRGRD